MEVLSMRMFIHSGLSFCSMIADYRQLLCQDSHHLPNPAAFEGPAARDSPSMQSRGPGSVFVRSVHCDAHELGPGAEHLRESDFV